jgi:hypothetical protein
MRHAVVTFLEDKESLGGVDTEFVKLVELFHQIPFCASFGVSCAGHFYEYEANEVSPERFNPRPWGHLNIIVCSDLPHIKELLEILRQKIISYPDTTFKKIKHVFGPPDNGRLEVWEIRIGDNGCLDKIKMGETWFGEDLPKKGNEKEYESLKTRCEEIKQFWESLADETSNFCKRQGFAEGFMLEKRVNELVDIWKEEKIKRR